MERYKERRDAVEKVITDLNRDEGFNFEVVRAEDFPALGKKSPQKACLDGVKESDIYLGIYGEKYGGWINPVTDKSPTEEEFDEAWKEKDKKHILIFIDDMDKEPRQNKFLEKVENYVDGRFRKKFENSNGLKYEVARALRAMMNANFEESLQNYLNALLKRYGHIIRPWGKNVSALPVSEIVQLELRVEEQKEEKKSSTEYAEIERHSEEISKRLMVSDAIKKNPRLLIIGDPGAGKSTSLKWITYSYADQILNSSQKELPVPIYLELWYYNDSLLELIVASFSENGIVCDEETITDWIKRGKFLFLLDGFDELDNPSKCLKEIKRLTAFSQENQFVVASRKTEPLKDLQNGEFKKGEVEQLSDSQIELFIGIYLGKEKVSRLLKELERHDLLNEAKNPLILWFMILEFQGEGSQISPNKGILFKNVIEHHFLKEWERKVIPAKRDSQKDMDLKIKVLSKLAFSMIAEEDSVKIGVEKANEIVDTYLKEGRKDYKDLRDEIQRQLVASHILIKVSSQVSFWHKSIRDYFAALELLELVSRDPEEFVKRYATERWEESILFLVGIMEDPSDFVDRLIPPFWRYFLNYHHHKFFQLSLAAKCVGANNSVNIKTQQKVIEQLTRIIDMYSSKGKLRELKLLSFPILSDVDKAFQALGEMKSEKAAEILREFLENHECELDEWQTCGCCQCAVKALWKVPLTEKAQNSLLYAALWHKDGVVKRDAIKIYMQNWGNLSRGDLSKLVQIISDINEECEIRKRALYIIRDYDIAYAKDRIYPDEVIDTFIKMALEEKCDDLRRSAASALQYYPGEDREDIIVNPFIHALLKNPEPNIRANAAHALVYHSHHKVREALIEALSDIDVSVLLRVAHALEYNKLKPKTSEEENMASQKLLRLFHHKDNDVRISAISTYGCIRRSPADEEITQLINLLKDKTVLTRYITAEALGRLEAKAAINALKQMVVAEKYVYPWASAI